jgi:CRISPR-associated protein Csb1
MPSTEFFSDFDSLLSISGPVAITIKQPLAPVNEDDPVIFPPSYPMSTRKGRVHTVRDGDYRVQVELPPDSKGEKNERGSEQKPGYNIDRFPDGTNCCEIDSPQSQANRIEPIFKAQHKRLVPQIQIKVGKDGTNVNLLDAGHRAADAVIRMSSLADKFHAAFLDVKAGRHSTLATLAPTSLLFGVWDSRSTYVKIQRVIKAYIRATNVKERTRSAQYTPAADYVAAAALDEGLDVGEGDKNPLSAEGMKHVPAPQAIGGVELTPKSEFTRFVNVNLAAVRELRGGDDNQTKALQAYVLGLALLAATSEPDLNLREGCNLRFKDSVDAIRLVRRRGAATPVTFDSVTVVDFAERAAEEFFRAAGVEFEKKDYPNAVFETGVAEDFLGLSKEDREKVSQLGPITAATLKKFHEQGKNPFKPIQDSLNAARTVLGKARGRKQPGVKNVEALRPVAEALEKAAQETSLPAEELRKLAKLAIEHEDSHAAVKDIEKRIKELRKEKKNEAEEIVPDDEAAS